MRLLLDQLASPIGTILLVSDGEALCALDFHDFEPRMRGLLRRRHGDPTLVPGHVAALRAGLEAYFDGDVAAADRLPVRTGGTAFQQEVWAALRRLPPGSTTAYGALAAAIGRPAAFRAVGYANGANPVAIAIPCHRLVGSDASLTSYAGGLHRKAWLIAHERRHAAASPARRLLNPPSGPLLRSSG